MAEARVVFTKSKMNKDLDERILTPGEYRDGFNISVSKSEGPDEGVVENVLGNSQLSNFTWNNTPNVDIIGVYEDTNNDRIFIFATNFTDSSDDQLSEFAYGPITDGNKSIFASRCFIAYIDLVTGTQEILVDGRFLNFSKTHPIYAVDLIEDLLFWTDNRNQPRKINVETAIANQSYYTNEDHISVSKYAPYRPLSLINGLNNDSSMVNETEEYLPPHALWPVLSVPGVNSGNFLDFSRHNVDVTTPGVKQMYFKNLNFPELGIFKVQSKPTDTRISYNWPTPDYPYPSGDIQAAVQLAADKFIDPSAPGGRRAFEPNDVLAFFIKNPDYNIEYDGDEDYLKDKFIRFSYRFKYDDGEYSLMAPFTQPTFIPKQYGYFIDSSWVGHSVSMNWNASTNQLIPDKQPEGGKARLDERDTASTGIVKFMENQVSTINFTLHLPENIDGSKAVQSNFADQFKVETIEILAKESDGLAIKVVEEIDVSTAFSGNSSTYTYRYLSNKPFKTLPEAVTTRVHDKVPIRALAQATTGNRVMYGNFIENHASPDFLNYFLGYREKPVLSTNPLIRLQRKEYPNHTLKQNRSYKVGVVLVDRYGRSSNVILRDPSEPLGIGQKDSTIYAPYDGGGNSPLNWPGNNVTVNFLDPISSTKQDGYPGLFSEENPLGYYSYKIVVQQQQQEYYNVYLAGATSGIITFTGALGGDNTVSNSNLADSITFQANPNGYVAGTTTNVTPSGTSGAGVGLIVDITCSGTSGPNNSALVSQIKVVNPGQGYEVGDSVTFAGASFGGGAGNNCVIVLRSATSSLAATPDYLQTTQFSNIALFGDNINKVPKELGDVGPTEEIYGSETLLFPRVVTTYIVTSSNIAPAQAISGYVDQLAVAKNSQIEGKFTSTVNSIISFNDLGPWTSQKNQPGKSYPSSTLETIDPLYLGASGNPFVAQISTDFIIGLSATAQKGETANPEFSRALNVFETDPVESKIEIYYESSSSGKISELNNRIINDIGFEDLAGIDFGNNPINLEEDESNVVIAELFTVDENGDPAGFGEVEIVSVKGNDVAETDYTNDFQLVFRGAGVYNLKYIGPGIPVLKNLGSSNLTYTFKAIGAREYVSSYTSQVVNKPPKSIRRTATWDASRTSGPNGNPVVISPIYGTVANAPVFFINNYSDDTATYGNNASDGKGAFPDGPWTNGCVINNGNEFAGVGILPGDDATNPPIAPALEDDIYRYDNFDSNFGPGTVTWTLQVAFDAANNPISLPDIRLQYGDPAGAQYPGDTQPIPWSPTKTLMLYNYDNNINFGDYVFGVITVSDRKGVNSGGPSSTTTYYFRIQF